MIVGFEGTRARRARRFVVVGFGLAMLVAGAGDSLAQTKSERDMARALMDEGDAKVETKDYEGALRAYRAAHTIMNVPTTGIEVARVEAELGRLVAARKVALEIAQMAPKPGEPKPFVEARAEAQKLAASLEARIPTLTIQFEGVSPSAPVELKIDGVLVPSEEVRAAHPLDPGKHDVSAVASGVPAVSKQIELAESQRLSITLSLGRGSSVETPSHGLSPLVYVGFGVGGAGLIAGAITGGLSLSAAGSVEDLCPGGVCPTQSTLAEANPQNDKALLLANVSNVAFALGVVGVGVGVAGIFLSGDKKADQTAALRVTVGPTGLGVAGRF